MQATQKTVLLGLIAFGLAPHPTHAQTINFDDIPTSSNGGGSIGNGYAGFNWDNFGVNNGPEGLATYGMDGYTNGVVSGTNAAFNLFGNPASLLTSTGTFTLNSGYFTAAYNDGLDVTITGMSATSTLYTKSFTVDTSGPTLETFDWAGLTSVGFASSGGASHGFTTGHGTQFVLDDLTVNQNVAAVPEPSCLAFVALGAGGLGLWARKRRAVA